VENLAASGKAPFEGCLPWVPVAPDDSPKWSWARYIHVSPEYFSLFQIRTLRDRTFTAEEANAGAPVGVISQATATRLWPNLLP
jgi:hypothetical protein